MAGVQAELGSIQEREAHRDFRTRLSQAFLGYGFGPRTLIDIREHDCLPFLNGKWETPDDAPTLPQHLQEIVSRVAPQDVFVTDISLSFNYAHIKIAAKGTGMPNEDARLFMKTEDEGIEVVVNPWITIDLDRRSMTAHQIAENGEFPDTYNPTRNVTVPISVVEMRELIEVIEIAKKAPITNASSVSTHPIYYPDMEEAVKHGIEIQMEPE